MDTVKLLPTMQRAAIVLFYLEDRPISEIADLLAISTSTCTVHLMRGRRRLAEVLSPGPISTASTPLDGTWRSYWWKRDS